jgi:hypothetical protein
MILRCLLERYNGVVWTGLIWLRTVIGKGSCEDCVNYYWDFIKWKEVIEQLQFWWPIEKCSVPWS